MTHRAAAKIVFGVGLPAASLGAYLVWSAADHSHTAEVAEARRTLAKTLWPVCDPGHGVARAAAVADFGGAPRPTVVFTTASGGQHYHPAPEAWFPATVEATQLVACFAASETLLEVCEYSGDRSRSRVQLVVHATVREARTARVIAARTFTGSEPGPCPPTPGDLTTGSYGAYPPDDALIQFVRKHVEPVER